MALENACLDCAAGSHTNNVTAATGCTSCPAGRYSLEGQNAGGDACTLCSPGEFQIASGQTSCNPCPQNQFQPDAGSYLCLSCEAEIAPG